MNKGVGGDGLGLVHPGLFVTVAKALPQVGGFTSWWCSVREEKKKQETECL